MKKFIFLSILITISLQGGSYFAWNEGFYTKEYYYDGNGCTSTYFTPWKDHTSGYIRYGCNTTSIDETVTEFYTVNNTQAHAAETYSEGRVATASPTKTSGKTTRAEVKFTIGQQGARSHFYNY